MELTSSKKKEGLNCIKFINRLSNLLKSVSLPPNCNDFGKRKTSKSNPIYGERKSVQNTYETLRSTKPLKDKQKCSSLVNGLTVDEQVAKIREKLGSEQAQVFDQFNNHFSRNHNKFQKNPLLEHVQGGPGVGKTHLANALISLTKIHKAGSVVFTAYMGIAAS